MGRNWSRYWNSNILDIFLPNQVQMRQCVIERWRVGGGLQVLLGLQLMLGVL